ncbi:MULTISPECIES: hypothetical protein [unclassified Lebetimonas]|uniref:hypothetical protein n=1 Tax=unclassified Lebetimonas TaxID=2648158 RepID=UPI000463FCE6|nr:MULTISPECIES: hypothetical protein [unclassified Lebetimonas]
MEKVITKEEFIEKFTHLKENYALEIETGKIYAFVMLDETQEMMQLIEPEKFEENVENLQNEVINFIDKLKKK